MASHMRTPSVMKTPARNGSCDVSGCSSGTPRGTFQDMATITEIEKLALSLPEKERATLAANLLVSLPGILSDEDEGVAEALCRDAELETNPDRAISLAQLARYRG